MNVKSVIAGEYTAPPVHGPRIRLSCGIRPLASTLRQKISAYPASETTPSWMRAPPESLMPMIGIRLRTAMSMTLITFSANTSPSEPPKTEASWLNSITSRPSILPMPVTTPSPGTRFDSRPKPCARWVAKMSISSNELRSTRRAMRSRAVSFEVLDAVPFAVLAVLDHGQDVGARPARSIEMRADVADVHQHAVDDVRHRRPLPSLLASLAVLLGAFVVGARRRQHDQPVPSLHLAVAQPAFRRGHACALLETERGRQPIHGFGPVLVREHRNHGGVVGHELLLRHLRGDGIHPTPCAAPSSTRRWSRSRRAQL